MAEDNMEISYDDHGDDDIDINIDIDQENQDDDYMIEDAHSEAGTNDDVMVDEDNTSFAMEDDDYMPDHTLEDVHAEVAEITEVEMTRATEIDSAVDNPSAPSTLPEEPQHAEEQEIEASQPLETAPPSQEETNQPEQPIMPVTTPGSFIDPLQEAPASPKKSLETEDVVHTDIAPPSPPKSIQHDHAHDQTEALSLQPTPKQELISEERTIMVQYIDTEYALVSSSEFDDPDSYFLKDSNVLKEPLSIFFAIIRDILGDEVGPQDELCLSIDDLGLETFEVSKSSLQGGPLLTITQTCLSNNDVTFAQLVDVHTTLSRNDGQTEMPPLYVTLNTKPEFGRSVEKMIENAKSGHGLNEIMESWAGDDGTDIWAGSEHGVEDETSGGDDEDFEEKENYDDAQVGHDEPWAGENADQADEQQEDLPAVAHHEGLSEQVVEQNEAEAEQASKVGAQDQLAQEQPVKEQTSQGPGATVAQADTAPSADTEKADGKNDDHDEEGDLIDYEDDDYAPAMIQSKAASRRASNIAEDLSSPCLKPASCFCSSCNKRLLAEYEEINEKLDRSRRSSRSSSQTLEGSDGDASAKPVPEEDESSATANQTEQNTSEIANVAEPDQNESYSGEYAEEGRQAIEQQTYEETDDATHREVEDDEYTLEDYTNYEEEPSENQPSGEQNGQPDATIYTDDVTEQPHEAVRTKDEDEISYEDDEAPETNNEAAVAEIATQSANVEVSSLPEDNEDEIDYDDDDDDRAEAHNMESQTVAAITQLATGKRRHDEPDALGLTSQGKKRARIN